MDALSDLLYLIKPRGHSGAGFDIGEGHSIRIPAHEGIFCYAVLSGEIWLSLEGSQDATLLKGGDCVILPTGRAFTATTDLDLPPLDAETVVQNAASTGSIMHYQGGGKCLVIGCHFVIDGKFAEVLLNLLSPVVHIEKSEDKATLRWALDLMRFELHNPQPGSSFVVEHLAHLMLVQALRLHLTEGGLGWLFAVGDKDISKAITAMHEHPAYHWTLELLAEKVGMSRTSFAVRFKEAVGVSPLDYLRRWRMLLAGNRLTTTAEPISAIARSLGYDSESAFSTAFKKTVGVSPRQYSQQGSGLINQWTKP